MSFESIESYKKSQIKALDAELLAQTKQVKDAFSSLSELKKSGYGIFPIKITNQSFGFAEYPEVTFKIPSSQTIERFKQKDELELFSEEGSSRASIIYLNNDEGKIRFYEDDFPEWLSNLAIGIRTGVDEKSIQMAKKSIDALDEKNEFFAYLMGVKSLSGNNSNFCFENAAHLNESQNRAVKEILSDNKVTIVHGPPGTGKTTTLVESIKQLANQGEKIIAIAPSNMAVDHLALSLIEAGLNVLRIGNPVKISEELTQHTIDGKLAEKSIHQALKKMKIQAEEFRKMASQYKRNFGKEEREQRKLIWSHFKSIKKDIQNNIDFYKDKWKESAQVICGTPVGLADELKDAKDKIVFIDEAGQCLQALAWIAIKPDVKKIVLAGDHHQLPPTLLSDDAAKLGLSISILDLFLTKFESQFLDIQYRMRESIASFSNQKFYQNQLKTPSHLKNEGEHLLFYDTAGTGYHEEKEEDGSSWMNPDEISLIAQLIEKLNLHTQNIAFISPYAAQVSLAKELKLPVALISSIDSFQGQEFHTVIISLVRSNEKNEIGFLKDYRRMNVAMTRAKEQLIVIGDSSTIANDQFYQDFINFAEEIGAYKTAWEIIY